MELLTRILLYHVTFSAGKLCDYEGNICFR